MYGAVPGGASNVYAPDRKKAGSWHDLDQEARLFAAILAAFPGELKTTEEVAALMQRSGHRRPDNPTPAESSIGHKPSMYEYLMGRLAWSLLKWGIRLRRSLEAKSRIDFDPLKK